MLAQTARWLQNRVVLTAGENARVPPEERVLHLKLRPRPELSTRVVDGERVILDRENGRVHQLNSTASLIWDRIEGGKEPSEIAAELAESFDVADRQAQGDVDRIVREFETLKLFESPARGSR